MSSDRNTRPPGRPRDYAVGYGKAPPAHRFRKGQSGNPRGRPKGAKSGKPALPEERLKAIVLEEAYRTITVRDGDRTVTLPMAQAIVRTLAVEAARGQPRAQRLFTAMLTAIERQDKERYDEWLKTEHADQGQGPPPVIEVTFSGRKDVQGNDSGEGGIDHPPTGNGSHTAPTGKLTSAAIDARDFQRARKDREISAHLPEGPLGAGVNLVP